MLKPFGERLVRPAEELDFQIRTGEIAEIDFAPRHPGCHRQAGGDKQAPATELTARNFLFVPEPEIFNARKTPATASSGRLLILVRNAAASARPVAAARRGVRCSALPQFQQQHKRHPKRERRKDVVVDRVKRRLRHERDERRNSQADEIIFRKQFLRRPASPARRARTTSGTLRKRSQ